MSLAELLQDAIEKDYLILGALIDDPVRHGRAPSQTGRTLSHLLHRRIDWCNRALRILEPRA